MVVAVGWYRKELVAASAEVAPTEAARLRTAQREGGATDAGVDGGGPAPASTTRRGSSVAHHG
jgi:hypothetical protein